MQTIQTIKDNVKCIEMLVHIVNLAFQKKKSDFKSFPALQGVFNFNQGVKIFKKHQVIKKIFL